MTDERFEFELRSVLREIAGSEAPASLRRRLADVTAQPPSHRLWFSPPMRIATVALAAVLALAFLLLPRENIGPLPTTSPTPSESAQSLAPSATASPTALPSATPEPTPAVTEWVGLDWSGSSLVTDMSDGWAYINDVVPWADGYAAVGEYNPTSGSNPEAAFFESTDGWHWTLTYREAVAVGAIPLHLLNTQGGLFAIGGTPANGIDAPLLWVTSPTEDGTVTWDRTDSPTWRNAWVGATLTDVQGGYHGYVAIGAETGHPSDAPVPVIIHASDFDAPWTRVELPQSFDLSELSDIALWHDDFVVVAGRRLTGGEMVAGGSSYEVAAWASADGVTWEAATAVGARYGTFRQVIAGIDGLFAVSTFTGVSPAGPAVASSGWYSTDGRVWQWIGQMGGDGESPLPQATVLAGNGSRMILIGRDGATSRVTAAWTSTDGLRWTRLVFTGNTPPDYPEEGAVGGMSVSGAWIFQDGVMATLSGGLPQAFKFGTAVGP